jgi:hypothetical protein
MIPAAFIIVISLKSLGNPTLVDPQTIFVTFASKGFGTGAGSGILNWLIAVMLILSARNAITGTARSRAPNVDRRTVPRFFQRVNHHGVPTGRCFQRRRVDRRRIRLRRRTDLHAV